MKLNDYMPLFLKNVREFNEIFNVEDDELDNLKSEVDSILLEFSIETAEGYGLTRFEKMLNITNQSNNIEERRFKIKSKLTNQAPLTYNWLNNKLKNLVGENNYKIDLNHNNYTISISISYLFPDIATVLQKDLNKQLPANLIITVNLFQTENSYLYFGAKVHSGDFIKIGGAN